MKQEEMKCSQELITAQYNELVDDIFHALKIYLQSSLHTKKQIENLHF